MAATTEFLPFPMFISPFYQRESCEQTLSGCTLFCYFCFVAKLIKKLSLISSRFAPERLFWQNCRFNSPGASTFNNVSPLHYFVEFFMKLRTTDLRKAIETDFIGYKI
jgi:hypothetical protein